MTPTDSETRERLLFLSVAYPYPLDRGQHVRIHHLVRACSRDYSVTLVTPGPGEQGHDPELESFCERVVYVDDVAAGPGRRVADSAHFLRRHGVLRRPRSVRDLEPWSAALAELRLDGFARIWVERLFLSALVGRQRRRTVVDLDDLEHRKWARALMAPGKTPVRLRARQAYYTARFLASETLGARRFLACVVASSEDARYLRRYGLRNVATVSNGADVRDGQSAASVAPRGDCRAVFVGNLAYGPNVDALAVLEQEVVPALTDRGLATRIDIIGPGATPEIRTRFPHLHFVGYVPDLRTRLGEYHVFLAPLRLGGGTKLKVLEAMAAGLPVVTTPVGVEGLAVRHGVHALIATAPTDLAAAVQQIRTDPALACSLATAAIALVRDQFSWEVARRQAADLLAGSSPSGAAPRPVRE